MLKNRKPQAAGSTAFCSNCSVENDNDIDQIKKVMQKKNTRLVNNQAVPSVTNLSYQGAEHFPVNNLRVTVTSYSNSEENLVNQTGTVHIKGKISVNHTPCLGDQAWPFNCTAEIQYGNINANDCRIGNITANMQIILTRRLGLQNPNAYNIQNVMFSSPPQKCQSIQPGINPGVPPIGEDHQ